MIDYPPGAFRNRKQLMNFISQEKNKGKRSKQTVKLWIAYKESERIIDKYRCIRHDFIGELTVVECNQRVIKGNIRLVRQGNIIPGTMGWFASPTNKLLSNFRNSAMFAFANFWYALTYYNNGGD